MEGESEWVRVSKCVWEKVRMSENEWATDWFHIIILVDIVLLIFGPNNNIFEYSYLVRLYLIEKSVMHDIKMMLGPKRSIKLHFYNIDNILLIFWKYNWSAFKHCIDLCLGVI